MTYDLYIDESGNFKETSTDKTEYSSGQNQQFPSQLAGLLVAEGFLDKDRSSEFMKMIENSAGCEYSGDFHSKNNHPGDRYDKRVLSLVKIISNNNLKPVRLVNNEKVTIGTRVETYTSMVAELILRICEMKSGEGIGDIYINLYYASVVLNENVNEPADYLKENEYKKRIDEYLARAAVRHDLASQSTKWKLNYLQYGSGLKDPCLQLCDLISNASHGNFKKCGDEAKKALKEAFGPYDFTMAINLVIEQADYFIREGLYGLALRILAERLSQADGGGPVKEAGTERLNQAILSLSGISSISRNSHLVTITSWLEQLINQNRELEMGFRLCTWFIKNVGEPLQNVLSGKDGIEWFVFALNVWALTSSNHQGNLLVSRKHSETIKPLLKSIAGKWDHVSIMMEGIIARAVHFNDSFDHEATSVEMRIVANYYRDLSGLFFDAMPDVFPEKVVSDYRGKALGTLLQAEIYAGALNSNYERLANARTISDEAIVEFSDESEKKRQYQYRSQLEAVAGDYNAAREYLARSLDLDDHSHEAIASFVYSLMSDDQGFPLLHWLRIGALCRNDLKEWNKFTSAFEKFRFNVNKWCVDDGFQHFPVHAILKWVSAISAAKGEDRPPAIGRLRNLWTEVRQSYILAVIIASAMIDVAGIIWKRSNATARQLLDNNDKGQPGAIQILTDIIRKTKDTMPKLAETAQGWIDEVKAVLAVGVDSSKVGDVLSGIGRRVVY